MSTIDRKLRQNGKKIPAGNIGGLARKKKVTIDFGAAMMNKSLPHGPLKKLTDKKNIKLKELKTGGMRKLRSINISSPKSLKSGESDELLVDGSPSQNIKKMSKEVKKKAREDKWLMGQGGVQNMKEDESEQSEWDGENPEDVELIDDTEIDFDFDKPAEHHFIKFKMLTIGQSLKSGGDDDDDEDNGNLDPEIVEMRRAAKAQKTDTGMEYIRKQALFAQKGKFFSSEAAQKLDLTTRECAFMGNQLNFQLVALRQKLKPFIDEGVIYKDRKLVNKKMEK